MFYHTSALARLRSNKIQVLHDSVVPAYTHAAKERILHCFYAGLHGTAAPINLSLATLVLLVPVSSLATLEAPFTTSEAKEALWQICTSSSPGPNGFGVAFYKTFWPVISATVMAFLDAFHQGSAELGTSIKPMLSSYRRIRMSSPSMGSGP